METKDLPPQVYRVIEPTSRKTTYGFLCRVLETTNRIENFEPENFESLEKLATELLSHLTYNKKNGTIFEYENLPCSATEVCTPEPGKRDLWVEIRHPLTEKEFNNLGSLIYARIRDQKWSPQKSRNR